MKQILIGTIFLALAAAFPISSPAAASDIAWSVGSAFRIGGASFHIAVRDGYYGGAPYYYRTRGPIHRPGYACGSACFRAEAYYYHDPYCPLATAYFSGYGYNPYSLFMSYGPPRGPYYRPGPPIYPGYGYSTGSVYGYYAPYGYNIDRRGSRYEYYDRRGHDNGNHHGHSKGNRGHDSGNGHD